MTTFRASVPSRPLAMSAPRDLAMVKTVADFVMAAQSHILSRPCRHEVSSMCAEAGVRTCPRSPSTRGLVDVRGGGAAPMPPQPPTGALQPAGPLPLQPADHPGGDRQPEQV